MSEITQINFTESAVLVISSPPVPANMLYDTGPRVITFSWDAGLDIRPYYYKFRTKIDAAAWTAWKSTTEHSYLLNGAAGDVTGQIEVKSTDGVNESAVLSGSIAFVAGDFASSDLAATVVAKMFTTSAKLSSELTPDGSNLFVDSGEKTGAGYANSYLDAVGIKAATLINATAASTVESNAADGKTANDKIVADVAAATLESTTGSQTKVDTRFSSAEKTNLETGLGTTLALLAGDKILISGTHDNIAAVATAVKTSLSLNNVENKTGATIMVDELDNAALLATTDALLVDGVNDNVIAGITASSESGIPAGSIASLKASVIYEDTLATQIFNSSGQMIAGGILSGATLLSPSKIISAINTSGEAQNLDLTSISTGDLDDIPETGVDRTVTVNEKLGAGYAYTGLNSSGYLKTSIYDGATTTTLGVDEVIKGIRNVRTLHALSEADATGAIADYTKISLATSGLGTYLSFYLTSAIVAARDKTLKFRLDTVEAGGDITGHVRLLVYNEALSALLATGTPVLIDQAVRTIYQATVSINEGGGTFTEGDVIRVFAQIDGVAAKTYDIYGHVFYMSNS